MSFLNMRFAPIVIQSSVLFVGFSTFLGRVYYLSYLESLGIPLTAYQLPAIDYAIISPSVTTIGIMLSILPPLFFAFARTLSDLRIFSGNSLWGLVQLPIGFLLAFASQWAALLIPVDTDVICDCKFWSWSTLKLFSPALLAMSAALFLNGILHLRSLKTKTELGNLGEIDTLGKLFVGICLTLALLLSFSNSYSYSAAIGESDAEFILNGAPQAFVELTSTRANDELNDIDGCLETQGDCIFRVVLISDSLIYLLPVIVKPSDFGTSIHSVPIEEIRQITYLPH